MNRSVVIQFFRLNLSDRLKIESELSYPPRTDPMQPEWQRGVEFLWSVKEEGRVQEFQDAMKKICGSNSVG